jgi:hypothetical protein
MSWVVSRDVRTFNLLGCKRVAVCSVFQNLVGVFTSYFIELVLLSCPSRRTYQS